MKPLHYDTLATHLGLVYIARSNRGLVAVQIGGAMADFRRLLRQKNKTELIRKPAGLRTDSRWIREYLESKRRRLPIKLDWSGVTPFRARVLRATARIPYGKTKTYGEIARSIGRPKAARAVGQALGANPFPLIIPCHRVVLGDGSLGGYSAFGGVRVKRRLLDLESRK